VAKTLFVIYGPDREAIGVQEGASPAKARAAFQTRRGVAPAYSGDRPADLPAGYEAEARAASVPKPPTSVRSARIPDSLWAQVLDLAAKRGVTATEIVSNSLTEYLSR
jgi:hypothetical protein